MSAPPPQKKKNGTWAFTLTVLYNTRCKRPPPCPWGVWVVVVGGWGGGGVLSKLNVAVFGFFLQYSLTMVFSFLANSSTSL